MAAILKLLLVDCGQVMLLNFDALSARLDDSPLKRWSTTLIAKSRQRFCTTKDRRLAQWIQLIENLPQSENSTALIDSTVVRVGQDVQLSPLERASLDSSIRGLMPWRKGPFEVCGYDIDTEWRSDAKWERLHSHISDLRNRTVLDVGCGSGYHCWRMRGAGAALVMGLEPSLLFCCQFEMLQHYIKDDNVMVLPLRMEDFPEPTHTFDTTFSMGVLYHRRSPFDHLMRLRQTLVPGGELVLETLVVDGPLHHVLVPSDRYAQMRNVWFLPSVLTLEHWLERIGFVDVRTVDVTRTTGNEQRRTALMSGHSLADFLDPSDAELTIEGYPAPMRAITIARRPY